MLNGKIEDGELIAQIDKMYEQGIRSFIERTYIGLRSDYPGVDFHKKTGLILERAKKHGMTVFLQAGYMPEAVLDLPRYYALDYLYAKTPGNIVEGETLIKHTEETDVVIRNSVTFLNMFNEDAVKFYIKQSYQDMWEEFREYFGTTVESIWVDEPSYDIECLPWSSDMRDIFIKRYGYDLFDKVHLLFDDGEGYEKVRFDYWTMVEDRLAECYFSMIRKWCNENNLKFSGHLMMEDTLRSQISRACATMPYYRFFDIPGIDKLMAEMNWRYDEIKPTSYMSRTDMDITTPIQCCSAARQNGQEHILCEMYGVTSNNFNFRDMKHMFDHFAAMGVNHRSVHGIFYSLHGRGKRAYPVSTNYFQPYFEKYNTVTDYTARTSWFISQGAPCRDVLVIHPLESAYMFYKGYKDRRAAQKTLLAKLDDLFFDTLHHFTYDKLEFDLGDEMSIRDFASTENGIFTLGKMSYRTVVLPYLRTLRSSTLPLLEKFAREGGKIVILGKAPDLLDGAESDTAERLSALPNVTFCEAPADALLILDDNKEYKLDFANNGSSVIVNHRKDAEGTDWFFLVNDDCSKTVKSRLSFADGRSYKLYNAENGEITEMKAYAEADGTYTEFTIPEGGSIALTAEKCASPMLSEKCCRSKSKTTIDLCEPWDIAPNQPNVLVLEYAQYKKGDGEYSRDYPILAIHDILIGEDYHGKLTIKFSFKSDIELKNLKLALEDADMQEVYFNGTKCSPYNGSSYYMSRDFNVISLPDVCKAGENVLEITRDYAPLAKFKSAITSLFESLGGVELESMYLLGDFSVNAKSEYVRNGLSRFSRNFTLGMPKNTTGSSIIHSGYPFYAGTVELTKSIALSKADVDKKAILNISEFHGCVAEIYANGEYCGDVQWFPYSADLTGKLREGENIITINLTNTLRNILGPCHRPMGDFGSLWSGYSNPNGGWLGHDPQNPSKIWYEERISDTGKWSDSYFLAGFGVDDVTVTLTDK
ncbi:MAG: hypothetical protein IKU43_08145 [Clostridia bacterium]|nr:hypothetical protein [Clostridia bacterium]